MQTGYILGFLIVPVFLEGCCVGNHRRKKTVLQQVTHRRYKAVKGEIFMIPCIESMNQHLTASTGEGKEGNEAPSFVCGKKFTAEAKHTGNYTYRSLLSNGSNLFVSLQVVEPNSLRCYEPKESNETLYASVGGVISCPGLNCSDNADAIWFKGNEPVSEQRRANCQEEGQLHLCEVRYSDKGVYFCDRKIVEQGITWTFRRAVNVTVEPDPPSNGPRIHSSNRTEAVELGQSHTLVCIVYFPFERAFSWEVQWYMNYGGKMENMTLLPMEKQKKKIVTHEQYEVIGRAIIKVVKREHLNNTYTCIASNAFGSCGITIKLKEKIKEKCPSLVGYPIVSLLLVAGLGIILHVKWLEVQLIYRSHFQHRKHDGDEKGFDVFLSYVWSPPSKPVEGVLTLSYQKGPDTDEEARLSSMDLLSTEEGKASQGPLEVLLPRVLEDQWGYRLCLPERDMLPGGAYTNDVVLAIQRSQMLICLLSADYLSNSNAVFELESGVQALLQKTPLKLLLIWTSRASVSLIQPEPPLPTLVQRALRVLPSLDWTAGKPARATSHFWRSLRKAMPDQRVKLVSLTQDR
ncbi:hypothetical protein ABVT39_001357 [Epinephelus coioides]